MRLLQGIHIWDIALFNWCMGRHSYLVFARAGRWVSRTADGPLYALFGLTLYLTGRAQLLQALALAFLLERLCYLLLKNSLRRNRPAQAIPGFDSFIQPSDHFSFPSGHTSGAFLIALFLGQLFPAFLPVIYVWAVSVALARIFLGVHFPTDTLVGAVMGTVFAWLSLEWLMA